jgi:hypothetical protein
MTTDATDHALRRQLRAARRVRLEQINLMMTLYLYRHCEERSDVAIQTAAWIATSLRSSQ